MISARDQFFFITLMIFPPSTEHMTIVCARSCQLAKITEEFMVITGITGFFLKVQTMVTKSKSAIFLDAKINLQQ
jgi:hypothetical protein